MSREMKDSGVEWIGKIPAEWEMNRIGSLYSIRSEKVSDKDYPPLSVTKKGVLPQLENVAKTEDGDNRKLVKSGDIVINSRSDRRGACGISHFDGSVSLINIVAYPNGRTHAGYYDWLFHTSLFADEFYANGHGIVDDLWTTNWGDMKKIIVPQPSQVEQKFISDFLDTKCIEIDKVVEKTRESIEEYKKLKQAVITEAVTKGVRGPRPMKPSGVEWMGEIPEEWGCKKLKYLAGLNKCQLSEQTRSDYEFNYVDIGSVEAGKGIVRMETMKFENAPSRARQIVKTGDVIIGTVRTYLKAVAIINPFISPIIVSTGFAVLRPQAIDSRFLHYAVQSEPFIGKIVSGSNGVSYPSITASKLVGYKLPIPNEDEQRNISDYLDAKCGEIDRLISKKEQLITELETYKKSLIYEYVTGKKEVPA